MPASERTFSIFEPHVELLKRGRREKPVEFGHKVLLTQTRDKFITHYEALEKQKPDSELVSSVLEHHREQFGAYPETLAADKGFRSDAKKMEVFQEQVQLLAIPKKPSDWGKEPLQPWQAFRAGIEGTISGLKRGFRLIRCFYRGFKNFAASIGAAIFCHNIVKLANPSTP